jgi:hypothetical protein
MRGGVVSNIFTGWINGPWMQDSIAWGLRRCQSGVKRQPSITISVCETRTANCERKSKSVWLEPVYHSGGKDLLVLFHYNLTRMITCKHELGMSLRLHSEQCKLVHHIVKT